MRIDIDCAPCFSMQTMNQLFCVFRCRWWRRVTSHLHTGHLIRGISFVTSHSIRDMWHPFRWISVTSHLHTWHLVRGISFVTSHLMCDMWHPFRCRPSRHVTSHSYAWRVIRDMSFLTSHLWRVRDSPRRHIVTSHAWHPIRDISYVTFRSWHPIREVWGIHKAKSCEGRDWGVYRKRWVQVCITKLAL